MGGCLGTIIINDGVTGSGKFVWIERICSFLRDTTSIYNLLQKILLS